MLTVAQKPLAEITRTLSAKTPIGSVLHSDDWADVRVALRESAFFSAGIESVRALSEAQSALEKILTLARGSQGEVAMDRSAFIEQIQKLSNSLGLRHTDPEKRGSVQDFGSERRLQLIYEQQIGQAQSKAYYLSGQDPDILDAWPAQELIRLRQAKAPRDWTRRWAEAGGAFHGGRMIALKTDTIWTRISRFERPWPPFDFGSGMGLDEIDREEAESLGLIKPGETIEPSVQRDQEEMAASVKGLNPAMRSALQTVFGDQIRIEGDFSRWVGDLIGDLFDRATQPGLDPSRKSKREVSLGRASSQATDLARATGIDIAESELFLTEDTIAKAWRDHGPDGERRRDQRPLTKQDFLLLPSLWLHPDQVLPGNKPRRLEFRKTTGDTQIAVVWHRRPEQKKFYLVTLYAKRSTGEGS